ncbi:MAG: hypothetical protein KGJ13_12570 [Patescibacteria group bacterium]|nr:hypothetical protein [Patescibacteria group bacterium]
MLGSEINVVLDEALDQDARKTLAKDISKLKGVFSAHFNEKAGTVRVHYSGLNEVIQEIGKIKGVSGFNSDGIHPRM